jgi:coproporphyrinogen III oxidase-like Fe-S oxidoreductase
MSINNKLLVNKIYSTQQKFRNIYVHLPFCHKKCHFCAFPVHAIGHSQSEENESFK